MRDYEDLVKSLRYCAEYDCTTVCPRAGTGNGCITRLKKDAADAIEELSKPKWISVEERLPEENANYLTYGVFLPLGVKAMDLCRFNGKGWLTTTTVKITHWMPLPEPPKEDDDA